MQGRASAARLSSPEYETLADGVIQTAEEEVGELPLVQRPPIGALDDPASVPDLPLSAGFGRSSSRMSVPGGRWEPRWPAEQLVDPGAHG
ncbi:MAG: hypothetical protein M3254_08515, partial [Actinomycetota bacterium]|nr:hypothetical protein [Actinomycetota bacterium]